LAQAANGTELRFSRVMLLAVVTTLWLALPVSGFRASGQHMLRGGEEDDTAYTLVQYSGLGCSADKYVCQHLTKGSCTVTTAQDGGVSFQVYSELIENADGGFTVKACEKSGCDCTYEQAYTANECKGGTWAGTSLSYQLLPGEVEGCVTYDFDVAGGRHHDAYESALANKTTFKADAEEGDASTKLLQHKVSNDKTDSKAPLMDVGGPVQVEKPKAKVEQPVLAAPTLQSASAFFHNWAAPAPSQGFAGKNVEHEDQETTTKDWGKEYGPDMYHYGSAALAGALLTLLVAA